MVSRSGTLTYEAVGQLTKLGIGQSTCIGIGGDPIIGTTFHRRDPAVQRRSGHARDRDDRRDRRQRGRDRGGVYQSNVKKPVVGFIAGQTAPPGRRMGHAGAIISGGSGKAEDKIAAMKAAGDRRSARSPAEIGENEIS